MEYLNLEKLAAEVVSGEADALKAYGMAKLHFKKATDALKAIEAEALDQAENYEKNFVKDGFKFEKRNGAKRFDFKHLAEWADKKAELTEIESKYKGAFQSFERGLKQVTDDGEIIELPKVSYSQDSLTVKPNE